MLNKSFPTAVILHQHAQNTHHDWLLVDPFCVGQKHSCKTFRVLWGPQIWADQGAICGQEIAHHRSHYLTYQGKIDGNRGTATPVDEGGFEVLMWSESRIVVDVKMYHFAGRAVLERYFGEEAGSLWRILLEK